MSGLGTLAYVLGAADRPDLDTGAIDTPPVEWASLAPLLFLIGGAVVLLVGGSLLRRAPRFGWHAGVTVVAALGATAAVVPLWRDVQRSSGGPRSVVAGAYAVDGFSLFVTVVICAGVLIAALLTDGYLRRERLEGPEPYILFLMSAAGGVIMASANDLIVMFLGLEILSIAAYVLAGMHRRRLRSGEAAIKYLVLGGLSSAFFLYGIALVYGATGTTDMVGIATFLAENRLTDEGLLLAGTSLLLVGFGFKVAAVPFHAWTPDVYQGSPTPVTGFMASAVKVAGFAGLLRVLVVTLSTHRLDWQPIVYGIAVLTLIVGAVMAVVQRDVKRMLAYSSINHAGFILVAVQAGTARGVSSALFYLAAYTLMAAGTFGVVTLLGRRGDSRHDLDDYAGLGRREPLLALALTLLLLAQAGVPLTSGFLAKFYVLEAAIDARSFWLALIAMVSTVISAFLYLRIVLAMYAGADDADEPAAGGDGAAPVRRIRAPVAARVAIAAAVLATVGLGFVPDPLTEVSRDARPVLVSSDR